MKLEYDSQNWWLFNVRPSIRIQQYRQRLTWDVGYSGGYQYYTQLTSAAGNNNRFSQSRECIISVAAR